LKVDEAQEMKAMTNRLLVKLLVLSLWLGSPLAFAQHSCTAKPCLKVGSQGWIVGEIRAFAFGGSPSDQIIKEMHALGWVECEGQPVARSTSLAPLFKAIADTWGSGDGSTGFYLPDFRGLTLRAWNHKGAQPQRPRFGGDPDAQARVAPRQEIPPPGTQGSKGDLVGSIQQDASQTHVHLDPGHEHQIANFVPAYTGFAGSGNILNLANSPNQSSSTTNVKSGIGKAISQPDGAPIRESKETRPTNVYVMYAIYAGTPISFDEKTKQLYATRDGAPKTSSVPKKLLYPVEEER
jgi:hypothetical protein